MTIASGKFELTCRSLPSNATRLLRCFISIMFFSLLGITQALGEWTSANHPKLKVVLAESPKADKDNDGVLSYAEYQDHIRSRQAVRLPSGHHQGPISMVLPDGNLLVCDFEEPNLSNMRRFGWKVEGEAFAKSLAETTRLIRRRIGLFEGKYLLSSLVNGDASTGMLLSPAFQLEQPFIEFYLSGGNQPHRVCVNLLSDGKVVRTVTGRDDDRLERVAFDVKALKGKLVQLQVLDASKDVWGHINVDHIVQTQESKASRVISVVPVVASSLRASIDTIAGHFEGPCTVSDDSIIIDGKPHAFDDLLLVKFDRDGGAQDASPHLAKLMNGERWCVHIVGFDQGKVIMRSPLLGDRQVPLNQIQSLAFVTSTDSREQPGTIYRTSGAPIQGKLVWIRDKDIAIDCSLGVIPLPRQTVERFVVQKPGKTRDVVKQVDPKVEPTVEVSEIDEVGMADGGIFRGTIKFSPTGVVMKHEFIDELKLPWTGIRYLRRSSSRVQWLDELPLAKLQLVGPIASPPGPLVVDSTRSSALRVIQMLPSTVAHYQLPSRSGQAVFRARLNPLRGSRSEVTVRIIAGGKTIWDKQVSADSATIHVAVDLPKTDRFVIEVDFAGPIGFPCGIEWSDAHVFVSKEPANSE